MIYKYYQLCIYGPIIFCGVIFIFLGIYTMYRYCYKDRINIVDYNYNYNYNNKVGFRTKMYIWCFTILFCFIYFWTTLHRALLFFHKHVHNWIIYAHYIFIGLVGVANGILSIIIIRSIYHVRKESHNVENLLPIIPQSNNNYQSVSESGIEQ